MQATTNLAASSVRPAIPTGRRPPPSSALVGAAGSAPLPHRAAPLRTTPAATFARPPAAALRIPLCTTSSAVGGRGRSPSLLRTSPVRSGRSPGAATGGEKKVVKVKFPDGSSYQGDTVDGVICGQGRWQSAGETYAGAFAEGVFAGQGVYTDRDGNSYTGDFASGAFEGVGTYRYADGRAEVGTYAAGKDAGGGARWSPDRTQAWRLEKGEVQDEVSLEEAAAIAADLGLPVPPSVYDLAPEGRERLQEVLGAGDAAPFHGMVEGTSLGGDVAGSLIAHSTGQLVPDNVCDAVVAGCEARAEALGGWTTERHENYPTTDVPLQRLPTSLRLFREFLLPEICFPFLAEAFGFALPPTADGSGDPRLGFKVVDAFVVKYDAAAGQRLLRPHRDGSVFSFNVALNGVGEYEGGGTYFRALEREAAAGAGAGDAVAAGGGASGGSTDPHPEGAVRSDKGHLLAHSSALMHGGHPIVSGVRYILVAFVTMEPAYTEWAYKFYEHVKAADGPEPEADE